MQHGCDGFEFDVRWSADGEPVICHDATVSGMEIANTASKTLPLPTLEDVLRQFAHRAFLDIELKVVGLERQTVAELRKHPPQNGYLVSSFLPGVLTTIHALDEAIPLGILCETQDQLQGWREMPAEWLIPQFALVDRQLVELVHGAGKKIMVWTVNRAEPMREFAEWGVDAIVSDETQRIAEIARAR